MLISDILKRWIAVDFSLILHFLFQNRFDALWQKYMSYTDGAMLFGYKCKEFPRLHHIRRELGMMQKLYKLYNDVLDKVNGYQDILWNNIDVDKITNELIEFQNR